METTGEVRQYIVMVEDLVPSASQFVTITEEGQTITNQSLQQESQDMNTGSGSSNLGVVETIDEPSSPLVAEMAACAITDPDNEHMYTAVPVDTNQSLGKRMCIVCMDHKIEVVFLPCTHMVTCASCASALTVCPICRRNIRYAFKPLLW